MNHECLFCVLSLVILMAASGCSTTDGRTAHQMTSQERSDYERTTYEESRRLQGQIARGL